MAVDAPDTKVDRGEFPFPIREGPEESRYLTWIRNHSNYMAARGLSDYSRAIGVLLRGIAVNFLIFVPYLLAISIAVAAASFLGVPPPFLLTKWLMGLFAIWIVLFLVLMPLFRIARYEKSRATGSDSSVKLRSQYERSFGGFVLAILAAAAVESLPGLLSLFDELAYGSRAGWPTLASTFAIAVAVFTLAPKLLSALGKGAIRSLALLAVGGIGAVVPLVFVLFVSHFIVFGQRVDWTILAVLGSMILPLGIVGAAALGFALGAWRAKDYGFLLLLLGLSVALFAQLNVADRAVLLNLVDNEEHAEAMASEMLADLDELALLVGTPLDDGGGQAEIAPEALGQFTQLSETFEALWAHREQVYREETSAEREAGPGAAKREAEGDPLLAGLIAAGTAAGLSAEIRGVVGRIKEKTSCGATSDACGPLRQELHYLSASAATVRELAKAHLSQTLAATLLELPKDDLDALRRADEDKHYPVLSETLGEDEDLEEARETLGNWGDQFKDARDELIVAAYMSPVSGFFTTELAAKGRANAFWAKFIFIAMLTILLWAFCWLTIDVNLTSIHGLYRDRLASAFLVGEDTKGDVDIEKDLDLMAICNHEEGSVAPYHLINVALNLQGSSAIGIRDRNSDFFIFSKKFIGGRLTGYCRSESMERVFPQMDLATAMAVSAGAASPNMGRATTPALVAVMTLLNVRLGFWIPNPGQIEEWLAGVKGKPAGQKKGPGGFSFRQVFAEELGEIAARWRQLPARPDRRERRLATDAKGQVKSEPTIEHSLLGIGFSGGGIRSATLNLGIAQALDEHGVFEHVDYMSTVSGGGYLGASISTLMRRKTLAPSVAKTSRAGVARTGDGSQGSVGELFRWRVRPAALLREILGKVDETSRLVNVSDGGHIENLAGIELLRRHCRYIILGDGEADGEHQFNGLATLIQTARIDLGIHIDIEVEPLRLDAEGLCKAHWVLGRVHYPGESERGYLLYLKSSITGDEDEVIKNYRHRHPSFPHESTTDQAYSEGQFEAYRSLGQHIGEQVTRHVREATDGEVPPTDPQHWFEALSPVGPSSPTRGGSSGSRPDSS